METQLPNIFHPKREDTRGDRIQFPVTFNVTVSREYSKFTVRTRTVEQNGIETVQVTFVAFMRATCAT